MSASCPAPECGFSGPIEAVCGHLGGSADPLHEGFGSGDLPSEGGSEGVPFPFVVLFGLSLVIAAFLLVEQAEASESASVEEGESDGGQEASAVTPSQGASEAPSEGGLLGRDVRLVEGR